MTNMGNYDSDALFFDMVNQHREEVNFEEYTKARIKGNFPFIERAVQNSINKEEAEIRYNRQVEKNKKMNRNIIAVLLCGTLLLGSGTVIAGKTVIDHLKINAVQEYHERELSGFLAYSGAFEHVPAYSRFTADSVDEVYHMKNLLSEREFDEFIRSQTYVVPDSGEVKHYNNFLHYLTVNGFRNERQFKNAAEDILLEQYGNGDASLNHYSNINVNYTSSKGGR